MVNQRRPQRASVHQPKYDTYAKPVLLSQPETQERPRLLFSNNDQDVGAVPEPSARKLVPGKLDLDKIRTFSQDDWTASSGQDAMTGSLAARKAPENSGSGLLLDNSGKENLLSPGALDRPNGTPLSRRPSDAAQSRGSSPKALPDVAMAPGQITIVAEAVAQYEQKILQGQRRSRGRFSNTSTPDVSRHASVCSSEHPTPREHQPLINGAAEAADSESSEQEPGSHAAENGSVPHRAAPDQAKAAEGHASQPGPSQSLGHAQGAAAEGLDATEDDPDAAAAAAATCTASGRHHITDKEAGGNCDEACSAAAAPLDTQIDSGGNAASMKRSHAASAGSAQQPANSSAQSDAEVLPGSTSASALPAIEPKQLFYQGAAASPPDFESACSATLSSTSSSQPEPDVPESANDHRRVEPPGAGSAAAVMTQSAEDPPGSSAAVQPGAAMPWSPSTAGHCERIGTVEAPGERADMESPSSSTAVNATAWSSTPAAPTDVSESAAAAAPSSSGAATPGSRGAAEVEPAARSAGPGPAGRSEARQQVPLRGLQLSAESALEPEWVAAFRRVVSLAVNTPLSQSPAARRSSLANGRLSDSAATPSSSGHSRTSVGGQAPSPSSEGPAEGVAAAGWRTGTSGGRNLDTAFESALTDCRRKRLRADESPHSSGSVVRAAAAVQRAAERATLDRNDYSGACISAEAASALSPGAIALVNGTMANSRVELQAQLNDVVHQLRFCLASMTEQQRPLIHAINTLQQGSKVARKDLAGAAEKLQEAERLRRWSEIAQSENIARLLGIVAELQAVAQARAEEVHLSAPAWLGFLLGSGGRSAIAAGRLNHC